MSEQGQTTLLAAIALSGLLIVLLALGINLQSLVVVHQTVQECLDLAVQAGSARAASPGGSQISPAASAIVRRVLAAGLAGIPLLDGTPAELAAAADIVAVHPAAGACTADPHRPEECYHRPFLSVRITVPIRVFWSTYSIPFDFTAAATVRDLP